MLHWKALGLTLPTKKRICSISFTETLVYLYINANQKVALKALKMSRLELIDVVHDWIAFVTITLHHSIERKRTDFYLTFTPHTSTAAVCHLLHLIKLIPPPICLASLLPQLSDEYWDRSGQIRPGLQWLLH